MSSDCDAATHCHSQWLTHNHSLTPLGASVRFCCFERFSHTAAQLPIPLSPPLTHSHSHSHTHFQLPPNSSLPPPHTHTHTHTRSCGVPSHTHTHTHTVTSQSLPLQPKTDTTTTNNSCLLPSRLLVFATDCLLLHDSSSRRPRRVCSTVLRL